jgi:hypothetical protein
MESISTRHILRLVVWICAASAIATTTDVPAVTGTGGSAAAYAQPNGDAAEYAKVVATLEKELAMPFSDPNDPGLAQRRVRLRKLFSDVPPGYAKTLFDRLGVKPTQDALSKEFHYRLSTTTRLELLGILAMIPAPAPTTGVTPKPTPPLVWGTRPLPASESARFGTALRHLEDLVNKSTDDRKWRYQCWFDKLKASGADDRVIEWGRICPAKYGATGAAYIVGPCDITWGTPVSQDELYKNIKSIADVEAKGAEIGIMTHLKSDFVVNEEMTSLPLENLRVTHDMVVMAIDKLDKWANNPMGGSSAMAKEYVSIKDWIGQRQRDSKSVYSCK